MPVAARKKAVSRRKPVKPAVPLNPRKSRSPRKRRSKAGSNSSSGLLRTLVGRLLTLLLIAAILLWFVAGYLVPQWAFSSSRSQNILIAPENVSEVQDVLLLAHIDFDQDKSALYVLDGTEEAELVGGYGKYQLQNIYPLLKMDKKDDQFIVAAFSHSLGVVVDKVLKVEKITPEMIGKGQAFSVFYQEIRQQPEFTREYLQLYYLTKNLDKNQDILNLSDFSKVLSVYQTLGAQTSSSCPVAVVNTTNTKDFAGNISRIIEENGGLVVRITNDSSKFTKSSLYVGEKSADTCQPLSELITKIFPASLEKIPANENLTAKYRAELILFLGEDAAETLAPTQEN